MAGAPGVTVEIRGGDAVVEGAGALVVTEVLAEMVASTRVGSEVWAGVGALGDREDPLMMGTTWEGAWEEVQWGKGGGDFNFV